LRKRAGPELGRLLSIAIVRASGAIRGRAIRGREVLEERGPPATVTKGPYTAPNPEEVRRIRIQELGGSVRGSPTGTEPGRGGTRNQKMDLFPYRGRRDEVQ